MTTRTAIITAVICTMSVMAPIVYLTTVGQTVPADFGGVTPKEFCQATAGTQDFDLLNIRANICEVR